MGWNLKPESDQPWTLVVLNPGCLGPWIEKLKHMDAQLHPWKLNQNLWIISVFFLDIFDHFHILRQVYLEHINNVAPWKSQKRQLRRCETPWICPMTFPTPIYVVPMGAMSADYILSYSNLSRELVRPRKKRVYFRPLCSQLWAPRFKPCDNSDKLWVNVLRKGSLNKWIFKDDVDWN